MTCGTCSQGFLLTGGGAQPKKKAAAVEAGKSKPAKKTKPKAEATAKAAKPATTGSKRPNKS